MANYYTQFSTELDLGSVENVEKAMLAYTKLCDEQDENDEYVGFDLSSMPYNPTVIWLHHHDDESGSPHLVMPFVLDLAEQMDLKGMWSFSWSDTCSKPRLDAFGGGCVVINLTKRSAQVISTDDFIANAIAEIA